MNYVLSSFDNHLVENHEPEATVEIQGTTYVWSNGECIKPVEICSVGRTNAKSSTGQRPTESILYKKYYLLVGILPSRLDLPFVFLAGPGELGALSDSLNTIIDKTRSPGRFHSKMWTYIERDV